MKKILATDTTNKRQYISASFLNEDDTHIFLTLQEGTGDNLLSEDEAEGYVDYVDYSFVRMDEGVISEEAGGILLLKSYVSELYGKQGLCDETILDEIIKMEDFVPVSDVFVI